MFFKRKFGKEKRKEKTRVQLSKKTDTFIYRAHTIWRNKEKKVQQFFFLQRDQNDQIMEKGIHIYVKKSTFLFLERAEICQLVQSKFILNEFITAVLSKIVCVWPIVHQCNDAIDIIDHIFCQLNKKVSVVIVHDVI